MSYEGFTEYLCATGHHFGRDCNDSEPKACPRCGDDIAFWNSVDQTNGYDRSNPQTYPAPRAIKGAKDVWKADHHGNRYAELGTLYEPAPGSRWRRVGGKPRKPRSQKAA